MDTRQVVAEALGADWHVRQDRPGVLLASTETAAIYVVDRPGCAAGVSVTVSTDEGGDLPRVLRALRAALAGEGETAALWRFVRAADAVDKEAHEYGPSPDDVWLPLRAAYDAARAALPEPPRKGER